MSIESTTSRTRDSERKTRVHLTLFDRLKFIVLFTITLLVLVWAEMANNPILSFSDAFKATAQARWWFFPLFGIEFIRQLHFLLAELLAPYHGIWQRYFAFVDRTIHRLSDWTRYRLSRAIKALLLVVLLAIVLGEIGRAHV